MSEREITWTDLLRTAATKGKDAAVNVLVDELRAVQETRNAVSGDNAAWNRYQAKAERLAGMLLRLKSMDARRTVEARDKDNA